MNCTRMFLEPVHDCCIVAAGHHAAVDSDIASSSSSNGSSSSSGRSSSSGSSSGKSSNLSSSQPWSIDLSLTCINGTTLATAITTANEVVRNIPIYTPSHIYTLIHTPLSRYIPIYTPSRKYTPPLIRTPSLNITFSLTRW